MTVRNLARVSNVFEASPDAIPLEALWTTAEAAALLGIDPRDLRRRAARRGIATWPGSGSHAYWTPEQIERLRAPRRVRP